MKMKIFKQKVGYKAKEMETSKFPLYDSLISNMSAVSKDLNKKQKEYFVQSVPKLPEHVHEIIYALIMHWCSQNINGSTLPSKTADPWLQESHLPFTAHFVDSGIVEFNFNIFPRQLKHLLYNFLKLHASTGTLS